MNETISNPDQLFRLAAQAAIEDFDDGSLVLLCNDLRLVELNLTARAIVGLLDGTRTIEQIAESVAQTYGEPYAQALTDITELLGDLESQGVVEVALPKEKGEEAMSDEKRYQVNPDVSCREEGPDGALLFNPDNDALMAVNPTGLAIWQSLAQPRTPEEMVAHLLDVCEGAPVDQIAGDVNEFVQSLLPGGFIGEVVPVASN
jgi:hypothetical protein